jgi:hypothetical protein
VRARFYNDNGCDGNGAGVPRAEVVLQTSATPGKAGCRDLTVGSFPAVFFDQSTLDQQSRSKFTHTACLKQLSTVEIHSYMYANVSSPSSRLERSLLPSYGNLGPYSRKLD